MKRTMAAYLTAAALAVGLAAANFTPAACQTMVEDELIKAPLSGRPVEIEVWVNKGEGGVYRDGEEVGIRFRARDDCYVVIYDVDTEGFLSLLFPDDLYDDGFVEGGRVYKLPAPRARYKLLAEGPPGIEYIAAVACVTPIALRLPWYLAEGYEAYGYRGHEELEATVSDVGAVRGDPYVAMRDIAYDILPENIHEQDYDTDHTYFHVGREERRHPRYLCYDCHGHVTWLDPYYDSCTVFDVRIDLDWVFISHPIYYPVGPRWWYWRRYDCPTIYIDYPSLWCSLYPRHLYWDYYWDGLCRVGHGHAGRGNVYIPPRYRGKPGFHDRGNYGKRYRSPHYGRGGGAGGKDVDRGVSGKGGRKYAGRGKGDLPRDVRQPERLAKLEDVRIKSKPDVRSRGREEPVGKARPGEKGRDYKSRGKSTERDSKARVKTSTRKASPEKKKSKLRIVTRSDRDKKSRGKSEAKGSKQKSVVTKKKSKSSSSAKKSSARSGKSKSKGKSNAKKTSARSGKSKSSSSAKKSSARSVKSKSKSNGKARKTSDQSRSKSGRSKKR